jgi:hypothetical protein
MIAEILDAEDLAIVLFCGLAVLFALGFFVIIFVADSKDAKCKAESRRALRRKRKMASSRTHGKSSQSSLSR